ncbi:hypothetical protein U1Q18_024227, partial [Sarracenia purpurea var. burkii]
HYANKCTTKQKLNELQDEGLRIQLSKLLLNSSEPESESLSSEDITSSSSDSEPIPN